MSPPTIAQQSLRTFDRLCAQQITPREARRIALDMRAALEADGVQLPDDLPTDHLLALAHVAACSLEATPPPPLSERPTMRFTPPPPACGDTGALRCTACLRCTRRLIDCSAAGLQNICLQCFDAATTHVCEQWIARCGSGWCELPTDAGGATRVARRRAP